MLDLVKFILVLGFLLYSCKLDLESRTVPNKVWKFMLVATTPITAYQLIFGDYSAIEYIIAGVFVLIVIALSYALYLIGAYGGADAKAIMALAVIFPFYPTYNNFPMFKAFSFSFAFSTLANSVIAAPFMLLLMFFRNLAREGVNGLRGNVLYYFTGYRVSSRRIPKFHNLLEFVDEDGRLRRVRRAVEPDERMLERLRKSDIEIWVTPALPFILFITAGYVLAFFVGDILYLLISTILGR